MAEKTRLEIFTTWGTLAVAGLWAVVGFYYTTQKDAFDRETRKYSIVTDFMKKCTSNDAAVKVETQRIMGFYLNGSMGTEATKEIFGGPDEFKKLSSACNTWISNLSNQPLGATDQQPVAPTDAEVRAAAALPASDLPASSRGAPSEPPNQGDRFWIFLGTYKKENNQWQTSYLNIPKGFDPTKFTVKTDPNKGLYKTVGNLNVRYGSFSPTGDFPPPTNTPLPSGHNVQLKSTAEWFDSGNWWATIEPPK